MTYILFTLLCSFLNTVVLYRFYNYIFNQDRKNVVVEISSYLLYWIFNNVIYFYINIPFAMAIYNIATFVLLTVNYYDGWRKRIFSALFFYFILALIEGIVVFVTSKVSITFFESNHYDIIAGQIFISIFIFAFTEVLVQRKNIAKKVELPNAYLAGLAVTPICTFIVTNFLLGFDINLLSMSICCVLFLVVNLVVFYLYDKIIAYVLQKKEHDVLVSQNHNLQSMVDNMRVSVENTKQLNHDLRNHAAAMLALADNARNEDLKEYIKNAFHLDDSSFLGNGNSVINSILNFKKQECDCKQIEFFFAANVPPNIDIADDVLTIVLGNLLDNAITATEKLAKNRMIHVNLFYELGVVYFFVENTYNGNVKVRGDQEYLTTKDDTEFHGYGIENVKKAVERNGGGVRFEHDERYFRVIAALAADLK